MGELAQLDADDEAMQKWKASLGVSADAAGAPPAVEMLGFAIVCPEDEKVLEYDLTTPDAVESLKSDGFVLKEKANYAIQLTFKVSGGIVSGLKYIAVTRRAGVKVDKEEKVMGSYGPKDEAYQWMSKPMDVVPSGMLARGTYSQVIKVVDDDSHEWAQVNTKFAIAKAWA